ncbi:MAG: thioredoxin domain-containing protein [Euryarchaeota archaeon]|nr:thioredoxin domain-containing protein [Euryarchaeota archaeon]
MGILNKVFGRSKESDEPEIETINTNLYKVNTAAFEQEVVQSDMPVVVDCYTNSCPPCKKMGPIFEKLAGEYEGRVKFVKVDLDRSKAIGRTYKVRGVPTLFMFKDGVVQESLIGLNKEDTIKEALDDLFGNKK